MTAPDPPETEGSAAPIESGAPADELPGARPVPLWRKLLGYGVGGAILLFLGLYVARMWGDLPEGGVRVRWGWFALSSLLTVVFFLLQAYGWKTIVSGLGPEIGLTRAWKFWFYSQVAKYVPGKVMLPLVRSRYCYREGTSIQGTLLSIAIEVLLMMITALMVAVIATGSQLAEIARGFIFIYLLVIPAGIIGIHPRILEPAVNLALKLIRRRPIRITLRYRTMLWLLFVFFAGWIVYGAASYLLCLSLTDAVRPGHLDLITGLFAFAWAAGFASFITPGGIGVREGALVLLLGPVLGEPVAALIALISRLQWTGLEIVVAGVLSPVKTGKEP